MPLCVDIEGKKKVKCAIDGKCCKFFVVVVINLVHMKIIMREV